VNLRSPRVEEPELILVPMIDVVLVLLIFFMITTTFRTEADLQIELPEASQQAPPAEGDHIEVAVDAGGRYFVNAKPLEGGDIAALKEAVGEVAGTRRNLSFVIRADAETPYQAVVTVMDAAGQMGFRRLSIATRQQGARDGSPSGER
jgi:biopolymer transport protein ExbD